MILNALIERLKRRSKGDFKSQHYEAALTLSASHMSMPLRTLSRYGRLETDFA
jgi:hypothetical protein